MGLLLYPPQTSSLANFQRHICNYQKTTAVHFFRLPLVTHKNTKFVSHFAQTKHCFSLIVLLMSYEKHPLKTMLTFNLPWKSNFQSLSVFFKEGKVPINISKDRSVKYTIWFPARSYLLWEWIRLGFSDIISPFIICQWTFMWCIYFAVYWFLGHKILGWVFSKKH